ncbi:MAG: hypothetical protein KDI82_11645, partial [Gammaproteobacteria bacterium]|nr:hypothetical protein [Gammaproteobacteria bacterium]
LEIMRLQDKGLRSESLIAEQLRAITGLTNERDDLAQQAAQLTLLRERLEADVAQRQQALNDALQQLDQRQLDISTAQRTIATLEQSLAQARERISESQDNNARLQETIAEQRANLDAQSERSQEVERRYLVLADDFDALKVKYDKLVRPARSSAGRHLIEVRYWKEDGNYKITWREGNEAPYQAISRNQLDKVLTRLAAEHEDGLYVKVIFPENSGLSYNEAWEFTSHMHSKYDYYFKAEAEDTDASSSER